MRSELAYACDSKNPMRSLTLSTLTLLSSVAGAAHPRKTPAIESAAPSESAASRAARLAAADDTGALRGAELRTELQSGTVVTDPNAAEHAPVQGAAVARSSAPLTDVIEALVARAKERNASAFDRCVADAKLGDPSLHGELTIALTVTAKRASAVVDGANVDPKLASCVVTTASTLRVSLPDLTFPWKVSLGGAVTTGGARASRP